MARISKAEHARILRAVDVEHRKVADVAAEHGCTPANIHALLGKLRRAGGEAGIVAAAADTAATISSSSADRTEVTTPGLGEASIAADLFAAAAVEAPASAGSADPATGQPGQVAAGVDRESNVAATVVTPAWTAPDVVRSGQGQPAVSSPRGGPTTVMDLPRQASSVTSHRRMDSKLAKPGFGLVMRAPEGDESLTPFRSLDDLLSAVKPILRAAARSPDAVWFSIQPIDLAALDSDAA